MSSIVVLMLLLALAGGAFYLFRRFENLPNKKKKKFFTKTVNKVFRWFEDVGLMRRTPAYERDYYRTFPGLAELEAAHADVKAECLELLGIKEQLTDMRELGAGYTAGGIHKAQWKAFMFASGSRFIDENCARAPKTTAILKRIPNMDTAFFSVLDADQYITPHWGYYKGYLRYHLGVVIPENNANERCWLRVHDDLAGQRQEREGTHRARREVPLARRRGDHLRRQLPARCGERVRRGARGALARHAPADALLRPSLQRLRALVRGPRRVSGEDPP